MLQKSVLSTLVYYDTFDYPLTGFEVWKHLLTADGVSQTEPVSLGAVLRTLDDLQRAGRAVMFQGFWVLPDRTDLIPLRIRREKTAVEKLKRASRLIRACSWLPFVRMIALTGSLSMKQGDRESDWDFLVVMRGGAIWTGRLLITLWLSLLGKRRHGTKVYDRACLNCYLSDAQLAVPLQDLFSSHEYRFLYPVIGRETFRQFELANRWMLRYRPNFLPTVSAVHFLRPTGHIVRRLQTSLEWLIPLTWFEPWAARLQRYFIEHNPKTALAGSFIEATDRALVFLPEPKGPKIFERFKQRLSQIA